MDSRELIILRDIGERFGIVESGASQASRRLSNKMKRDKELRKLVEKLEDAVKLSNV